MKKINIVLHFILLVLGLNPSIGISCECSRTTKKFIDDIDAYKFVGIVEVIGYDTLQNAQWDYTFTTVVIVKCYKGKISGDTIHIVDSKGFDCFSRLRQNQIGSQSLVKGFFNERKEYEFNVDSKSSIVSLPEKSDEEILELSLCDYNQLELSGNGFIGHFTKNNNQKVSSKKAERILRNVLKP